MAFIGFGKINKNIIPLILGCIFCLLNRLLNVYIKAKLYENVILTNIFLSLAHTLIIIPYIIYQIATKKCRACSKNKKNDKNKEEYEQNNTQNQEKVKEIKTLEVEYIYNGNEHNEDVPGKIKYTIFIALIFFANYYLYIYTIQVKSNTWIIYIVFSSLFYYLIFKSKLFRHHYLCICLILTFGIIIDVLERNFQNDAENQPLKFFFSFLRIIILSFNYVLIKYTMEKKYLSPYILGTFSGLINLVLFIIWGLVEYFCFKFYEYSDYFSNFNKKELFALLGLMITQLGIYTSLFFIDKNDSPCHIFIVFTVGQFGYEFSSKDWQNRFPVFIICLILILFFSLVFNEIIELRFLGLAYNTKKNIAERAKLEIIGAMIVDNDSDDKSEDSIEMVDKSVEYN